MNGTGSVCRSPRNCRPIDLLIDGLRYGATSAEAAKLQRLSP